MTRTGCDLCRYEHFGFILNTIRVILMPVDLTVSDLGKQGRGYIKQTLYPSTNTVQTSLYLIGFIKEFSDAFVSKRIRCTCSCIRSVLKDSYR